MMTPALRRRGEGREMEQTSSTFIIISRALLLNLPVQFLSSLDAYGVLNTALFKGSSENLYLFATVFELTRFGALSLHLIRSLT